MTVRTYRFAPRDRTGLLLGLSGPQAVVLGGGLVGAALALSARAPVGVAAALAMIAAVGGFAVVGGEPVVAILARLARWVARNVRGGLRWRSPIVAAVADPLGPAALPPALDGQNIFSVTTAGWPRSPSAGIVRDRRTGQVAASVRVSGRGFALADRVEQDRLLALWADALGAFCVERSPVTAVRWSEWTAPADLEPHYSFLDQNRAPGSDQEAVEDYQAVLDEASRRCVRRETLVTVTCGGPSGRHRERVDQAVGELLAQLRMFASRLDAAGLTVSAPLTAGEIARAARCRLDPSAITVLDRRGRSLGEATGFVAPANAGPLCTEASWRQWVVDGAVHRVFVVAEWPRVEVPAGWMGDLLIPGHWTRVVTLWAEPVAPAASRRRIERQSAKLDADEDHRRRTGLRVGAEHRRARAEVAQQEAELVSGYAEFAFVGLVAVTATDREHLDQAADEVVQTAAGLGVELRPLHGRHDEAFGACLPFARGLSGHRRLG